MLLAVIYLLCPLACVGGAIYLLIKQQDGWGWLLIVALIMLGGFSYKSGPKGDKSEL